MLTESVKCRAIEKLCTMVRPAHHLYCRLIFQETKSDRRKLQSDCYSKEERLVRYINWIDSHGIAADAQADQVCSDGKKDQHRICTGPIKICKISRRKFKAWYNLTLGSVHKSRDAKISVDLPPVTLSWRFLYFSFLPTNQNLFWTKLSCSCIGSYNLLDFFCSSNL